MPSSSEAHPTTPTPLLGHLPEAVYFDGEHWIIDCECAWGTWGRTDQEDAWDDYDIHVEDDFRTALRLQREWMWPRG